MKKPLTPLEQQALKAVIKAAEAALSSNEIGEYRGGISIRFEQVQSDARGCLLFNLTYDNDLAAGREGMYRSEVVPLVTLMAEVGKALAQSATMTMLADNSEVIDGTLQMAKKA